MASAGDRHVSCGRLWVVLCCLVMVACKKAPEPPVVTPAPPETLIGIERLGWGQPAADEVELAAFRYAVYVDGARLELTSVSCVPSSSTFTCSAPVPSMSAGAHTLELATFIVDGAVLESARSAPLQVIRMAAATAAARPVSAPPPATAWPSGLTLVTSDGTPLRLERIAEGLAKPTDLAFAPDGRLFVAEDSGRIRVLRGGQLLAEPALTLPGSGSDETHVLALAVDPLFDRTHFVFVIYTMKSRSGRLAFVLARFREASNTLADRVVLLDDIQASPSGAAAALRIGADGKLFAAFDDGGNPRLAGDLASPNGKILRLNLDGTTPDDQEGAIPMYSYEYHSPRGFDWRPTSNVLWIADRDAQGAGRLVAVVPAEGSRKRGSVRTALTLPRGTVPSSVAFYRGASIPALQNNLLIASDEGRHLLRIQFDRSDPTRVVATERLLHDRIGGVRFVASGPDGAMYIGTTSAIGKLVFNR